MHLERKFFFKPANNVDCRIVRWHCLANQTKSNFSSYNSNDLFDEPFSCSLTAITGLTRLSFVERFAWSLTEEARGLVYLAKCGFWVLDAPLGALQVRGLLSFLNPRFWKVGRLATRMAAVCAQFHAKLM